MAANYASHVSTRKTPQSQPVIGKSMVANSAGGYTFAVTDWQLLERFLILGQEGPTYYASEKAIVLKSAECVLRCAAADLGRTINTIVQISENGRAPKNDPAIFALALIAGQGGAMTQAAMSVLRKVCRIGTHLFQFVQTVQELRGWGRALKRGVGNWYLTDKVESVAYGLVKYQQRNGMSHRDVLRLTHPRACDSGANQLLRYAVGKPNECDIPIVLAFEQAKKSTSPKEIAALIREHNLPRECIPTNFLNDVGVWEALLEKMPMTAMVRNLGKMSAIGLTKPLSAASKTICEALRNPEALKKAKVHPMQLLIAQRIYSQGHGDKGSLRWGVDQNIVQALDDGFHAAFNAVVPAGKRFLLGLDVSASMASGNVAGSPLTPRDATAAMAMVTLRTEPWTHVVGFTSGSGVYTGGQKGRFGQGDGISPLALTAKQKLQTAIKTISNLPFGGTDCALPMLYAEANKLEVDAFVVMTDNETGYGAIHPFQALKQYRKAMGINAKLIVVSMVANNFSIADPSDFGMLDVVGFDTATPALISDFVRG